MSLRPAGPLRRLRNVGRRIRRAPPPLAVNAASRKREFRRLLRSVVATDDQTVARPPSAVELSRVTPNERTRSLLVDAFVPGRSAPVALISCVRALVIEGNFVEARSLTRAARGIGWMRDAGKAAAAVIAVALGRFDVAERQLRDLPPGSALGLVPAELVAVQ